MKKKTEPMNDIKSKYVDPTYDWSFRRIFLTTDHNIVLKSFLNDVLKGEIVIDSIQSVQKGGEKDPKKVKNVYFDVSCTDKDGREYIIEMQRKEETNFLERMDFYRARALSDQLRTKERYSALKPVIVVAVCNFKIISDLIGKKHKNVYFERIGLTTRITREDIVGFPSLFVILDLPAYRAQGFPHVSELEDWFTLFTCHTNENQNLKFKRKPLTLALDALEFEAMSQEERIEAELEILKTLKEDSVLEAAVKRGEEKGVAEGLAEGMHKGMHKGIVETAQNFLALGVSVEQVVKATGLSIEEVKAMKKQKK